MNKSDKNRGSRGKKSPEEEVLDRCVSLAAEGAYDKKLKQLGAKDILVLLLKRADQRRADRLKDDSAGKPKRKLTPKQRQERVKQIFGLS